MDTQSSINLDRLKDLSNSIDEGRIVKDMVESDGFQKVVGPMLDKMIVDVLGQKENGRWHNGSIGDARLGEERLRSLCAYKRALTDFHAYLYNYIDQLPKFEKEYSDIVKDEENTNATEMDTEYNVAVIK